MCSGGNQIILFVSWWKPTYFIRFLLETNLFYSFPGGNQLILFGSWWKQTLFLCFLVETTLFWKPTYLFVSRWKPTYLFVSRWKPTYFMCFLVETKLFYLFPVGNQLILFGSCWKPTYFICFPVETNLFYSFPGGNQLFLFVSCWKSERIDYNFFLNFLLIFWNYHYKKINSDSRIWDALIACKMSCNVFLELKLIFYL